MWAEFFSQCDSHCEEIVSGDEYPQQNLRIDENLNIEKYAAYQIFSFNLDFTVFPNGDLC